uniref:Uncharacterized protein n=1 Tax=Rhodnius prolixus TaxID=13249 RepID=T1HH58_RHOPR
MVLCKIMLRREYSKTGLSLSKLPVWNLHSEFP